MSKYEPQVATAVIGVAGWQILQAWNSNAPTLADMRAAHPDDVSMKQKLLDADFMVGGLATILGVAFAVMTKDVTALVVMLTIYGACSLWFHSVQKAEPR